MSNYSELINCFEDKINLSFTSINKKAKIIDDTKKSLKEITGASRNLAIPIQKHTNIVSWVDTPGVYKNCDGIATNLKYNLILSLSVADCTPVCIFDPENNNYALIHSGWRGTHKKISNYAVKIMQENGSNIEHIVVYFGPSISQNNYEVDDDVASLFSKQNYVLLGEKYLLDIKSQIRDDMIEIGVKSENISQSERCTYNEDYLHSFRRDKERAGRMIFLMGRINGRV